HRFAAPRNDQLGACARGAQGARMCAYTGNTEILRAVERDQRETCFRVLLLAQMRWGLRQDDFEGWAHMAFEEMTADDAAVELPEHGMDVQDRLAVRFGDIADQRQNLDLLIDRDALIVLCRPIEIADDGTLERADRGQPRGI